MDLTPNIKEAQWVLTEQPMFATTVERFLIFNKIKSEYKDLPQPKRFAKFLSILLEQVSVPLQEYDLIAGRCIKRELTGSEEETFQEFIRHPDYPKEVLFPSGHCTYSWEMVLRLGLTGLKAKAEEGLAQTQDGDKRIFLESMICIYDSIRDYILRYAAAAEQKGMSRLSHTLHKVATQAPDDFQSGLQLLWMITFINCAYITENPTLTVGRLDQILYPLYRRDIERGILTDEQARDLITDYYCKHNLIMGRGEHQVGDETNSTTFRRILCFDAPQYLLLAGTDADGNPAVNELTHLFADCIRPELKNPVIVVRYFKDMNIKYPRLWATLTERSLQSASMMYYNDDNILSAYHRMGIPHQDALKYEHFGCNWPCLGEDSVWMQGAPTAKCYGAADKQEMQVLSHPYQRAHAECSWPQDLMDILQKLSQKATFTIDEVYDAFFDVMGQFAESQMQRILLEHKVRRRRPSAVLSYTDCFTRLALEKGECHTAAAKYGFGMLSFHMFGTIVDCFTVVDELVLRQKRITLSELMAATENDFEKAPEILALCRGVEKYGSNSALSNYHAYTLARRYATLLQDKSAPFLEEYGLFFIPTIQSDTWHLKMGEQYPATVDGRRAHTPFSQNLRPNCGAAVNGIAAMLQSVALLPRDALLSGALNLDIDISDFEGEKGKELFGNILAVYLNNGGLHAQVTALSVSDLLDAQIHPHLHRDLRVRVTGYSGVFVDICKRLQDDIIERMKG